MNCSICNKKLYFEKKIQIKTIYFDDVFYLNLDHHYCKNCKKFFLDEHDWKFFTKMQYRFISDILKNKYKNDENWINIKNIDIEDCMINFYAFSKIENKQKYVLKESYEKYIRCKNGFFWIGKEYENFKMNDDFYDSIYIENIKDNKIFLNNKIIEYKINIDDIKFYGYGGIVFKNGNTISIYDLLKNMNN